jgi:hypothetical protein
LSKQKNDNYNLLTEREKLLFLAGVFEGEGSFGFWSSGYKGKRYFGFTIKMTDKDIIERFIEFFKLGRIEKAKIYKDHHKQAYVWRLTGKKAINVVLPLVPYLGIRRKEKFKECSQHYKLLHH